MKLTSWTQERRKALTTSRQNDPTVKQREHAIQSLELAYHKCKEIEANLAEGTMVSRPTRFSLNRSLSLNVFSSTKTSRFSSGPSRTIVGSGRTNVHPN